VKGKRRKGKKKGKWKKERINTERGDDDKMSA
jgi:hypothetical protein